MMITYIGKHFLLGAAVGFIIIYIMSSSKDVAANVTVAIIAFGLYGIISVLENIRDKMEGGE